MISYLRRSGELLDKVSKIEDILNQAHIENKEAEALFSIKQAAKFLNFSISTMYEKVCRREIPLSKQGKRLYFNKTELLEWARSGRKRTLVELAGSASIMRTQRN